MVTRLSGTPLFAKLRLKKLIKAASGGLFYARQRVTTEGKSMDRFKKANAAIKIDGYYLPRPEESSLGKQETAFNRAKEEALTHLKNQVMDIEDLTYEDFRAMRASNFK